MYITSKSDWEEGQQKKNFNLTNANCEFYLLIVPGKC